MIYIQNKVSDITNNYYRYLMNLENVNGVGFGNKHINGVNTKEPCIHVLVEKKVKNQNISSNNIIPKTYMGIKTDVIEVGVLKELGIKYDGFTRIRPLQGGYLISSGDAVGTLGCIVSSNIDFMSSGDSDDDSDYEGDESNLPSQTPLEKHYYILSNNHVLTNNETKAIGSEILQPGIIEDDKSQVVARLATYIPIKFMESDQGPINEMDCALAKIYNNQLISNKIASIGKIKGVAKPSLGAFVEKAGAFSGVTFGSILTMNATHTVQKLNKKQLLYKNQIIASMKSEPGDSGSVVLDDFEKVIGLLFAGGKSDSGEDISVFSDISSILFTLGIDIYTT